jgi:hypothetical protein
MAWTTPKIWASEPLISTDLNTYVRDNQTYLKDRIDATAKQYIRTSGDYSTTSSSLVDIDATNLALTLTTLGGDVRVTFTGMGVLDTSNNRDFVLAVDIDGTPYNIMDHKEYGQTNFGFTYIFTGLTAGSHTFKMQWSTSASTLTLYAGTLLFDVREEIGVAA